MSIDYKSTDFDRYAYYVAKAHELRAAQWRRTFLAMFRAPGVIARKCAMFADRFSSGKRVAS